MVKKIIRDPFDDEAGISMRYLRANRAYNYISKRKTKKIDVACFNYDFFCGVTPKNKLTMKEISINDLPHFLEEKEIQILDVRMPWEQPKLADERVINIPLQEIPQNIGTIDKNIKTLVLCQHGVRSVRCIEFLENEGFNQLINLKEGLSEWK